MTVPLLLHLSAFRVSSPSRSLGLVASGFLVAAAGLTAALIDAVAELTYHQGNCSEQRHSSMPISLGRYGAREVDTNQIFGALAGVLVGAALGWIGNYMMHRLKQSSDRRDRLSISYSRWFTLERMAILRLQAVDTLLVSITDYQLDLELVADELNKLVPVIEGLLESVNSVSVIEGDIALTTILYRQTENIEKVYSALLYRLFIIRSYLKTAAKNEEIEKELASLPEDQTKDLKERARNAKQDSENTYKEAVEGLRSHTKIFSEELREISEESKTILFSLSGRLGFATVKRPGSR